jgi:hypothetical protein
MFGNIKIHIDPLHYNHYRKSLLGWRTDGAFLQFTVQELRMVVNSDASDDQLVWCHRSLKNYLTSMCLQMMSSFVVTSSSRTCIT